MIAVIHDNGVLHGPVGYDVPSVQETLFVLGYTRQAGVFTDPDGQACPLPDAEPTAAVTLPVGRILPVVDAAEEAPAGMVQGGTRIVLAGDVVERRPVWVDGPSLDSLKAAKQHEIKTQMDAIAAPLAAEYPEYEKTSWPQQEAEAAAYLADNTAAVPTLTQMVANRQNPDVDLPELARRIQGHALAWKKTVGALNGQRQKFQDALDAATTVAEVQAIVVTYSLPQQ